MVDFHSPKSAFLRYKCHFYEQYLRKLALILQNLNIIIIHAKIHLSYMIYQRRPIFYGFLMRLYSTFHGSGSLSIVSCQMTRKTRWIFDGYSPFLSYKNCCYVSVLFTISILYYLDAITSSVKVLLKSKAWTYEQ